MARLNRWIVGQMERAVSQHPDDCMILTDWITTTNPRVTRNGHRIALHRWLYETATGTTLGKDIILVPTCNTTGCQNPFHRTPKRKRGFLDRTRCPNGHPYTPKNVAVGKTYKCIACHQARLARARKGDYGRGYCHRGHRLTGQNVYTIRLKNGSTERKCRKCQIVRQRQYRQRLHANAA